MNLTGGDSRLHGTTVMRPFAIPHLVPAEAMKQTMRHFCSSNSAWGQLSEESGLLQPRAIMSSSPTAAAVSEDALKQRGSYKTWTLAHWRSEVHIKPRLWLTGGVNV